MRMLTYLVASILALSVLGCQTDEQILRDKSSVVASAAEVKELLSGNTVTSLAGDTFYWDSQGWFSGKVSSGSSLKGQWNITDDGMLCVSNLNGSYSASSCHKVFFDNSSGQHKVMDLDGNLKYVIINRVAGNPYKFN